MTARNYDVIIKVDNATPFETNNVLIGNTSSATGVIANVNSTTNELKVKLSNSILEFSNLEVVHSNVISISGTANGLLNTTSLPFQSNTFAGNTTTAIATIESIGPSGFIAEKNAFTQNPVVRLFEIFYPGEWYPENLAGNPTLKGEGRTWPTNFPIRFADIRGDLISDLNYNVSYGSSTFIPFPSQIGSIEQASDGKINELSLTVFNVDNIISALVEDPFIVGNNISNACQAFVNGELVHGIDPRTIDATNTSFGLGTEGHDTLTRARANGLAFSADVTTGIYGKANSSFTRDQTIAVNGEWREEKSDTRDLLGAVVSIKTTFANFLDYWPEYSTARFITSNVVEVYNALPYRVGDNVRSENGTTEGTIQSIEENRFLYLSNPLDSDLAVGDAVFIINPQADSESYIEDKFKIDSLESLSDEVATFSLISWLQYFRNQVPNRKYYKNTCQWAYKGPECQYPGPGGLAIPGTSLTSNANPIAANNNIASSSAGDVCGKSLQACTVRNNQIHFGGFPATGRTIPKQ
tara:strand:+ start:2771 stop:4345 length:1575 start_codon:yes stop_codon:yes gene_type:complete